MAFCGILSTLVLSTMIWKQRRVLFNQGRSVYITYALDKSSVNTFGAEDGIFESLHAIVSADRGANPCLWWKGIAESFSNPALTDENRLSLQAYCAANELKFSVTENLIYEDHRIISDESLSSCMCVASCKRFLNKN